MKPHIILALIFAAGCSSGGGAVTADSFYNVPLGATKPEMIATIGQPYSVKEQPDGTVEYEYIEKITEGARILQERHYIITMKDGKVVSKRMKPSAPAPYLFDSYEMQTTQVETEEEIK